MLPLSLIPDLVFGGVSVPSLPAGLGCLEVQNYIGSHGKITKYESTVQGLLPY